MKKRIIEIESLLVRVAKKHVSIKEAEYFAKEQIDTHLKKFPRVSPLETALKDLESWGGNPKNKIKIQVNKPSSLLLNFNKLGPSIKLKYIHDELESRSKKNGISIVGINNSAGIHTLNLWTNGLAKRGLIGICLFNGGPDAVVPYGGTKGIFGTNPISFSIPTENDPIIMDMATSEIPFFEVVGSKEIKKSLKKGVAVDSSGKPTVDPNKALNENNSIANLLPIGGGYKGYGLVMLIEILTGSLVRSRLSSEMSPGYVVEEHGGLIIAIDIKSFTNLKRFTKSVSEMCSIIRKQKPALKGKKVIIPGDLSYSRAKKILKSGVLDIKQELYDKLVNQNKKENA